MMGKLRNNVWWVVDSLEKVFPETSKPFDAPECIELWAAGNETEDAQIAIAVPPSARIKKASFRFTPLTGPKQHRIGLDCCRAHWEWYTYVLANPLENTDPATYLRKAPAFFPDAFLEEKEIPLRSGITQPVWISVYVPPDTPSGTYAGKLSFSFEGMNVPGPFSVPVVVHVWPFRLPEKQALHHTEWFYPGVLGNYYHIDLWSEAHWLWIERVAADMARHKQDMILTDFTKLVTVVELKDGSLTFDFSRLDRWLAIFGKAGIDWIEGSHVAGGGGGGASAITFSRWSPLDASGKPIDTSVSRMKDAKFEHYVEHLLKAVYAHLKSKGLAKRYVQHIADEPNAKTQESWSRISRKIKQWLPDVPRIDAMPATGMAGDIEIRVPMINEIHGPVHCRPPEQLWSYVCLSPQTIYPNRFLDYCSARNRIIYWLSWSLRLKGFLHWGYNYWRPWGCPIPFPVNPWTDSTAGGLYHPSYPLPAGDPHIVYPGKTSICSSIRWETVRKGFEDYEYLNMLASAVRQPRNKSSASIIKGRELLAFVRTKLAKNPVCYSQDHKLLQAVRKQTGELLAKI